MGKKKDKAKVVVVAPVVEPQVTEPRVEEPQVEEGTEREDTPPRHDGLVSLMHRLIDTVNEKTAIPALHETCSCGGMITLSEVYPEADRRRMHNAWVRRHKPCMEAGE